MPEAISVDDVPPSANLAEAQTPSFDDFVATRSRALWRSAWLLTGDAQKAEDLLQTALVKVWRRWPKVAKDGSVEAYARRALVTTYTDWWRRKWTGEVPTEVLPELDREGDAATEGLDLAATRHDLVEALARLSRGQRAVVVLRYFEDLTEAETASALGCSVGTVKSQHSRAMTALRLSPLLNDDNEETR
jgi:RNA polymerase sigma-70 factor (sigma-E family)